MKILVWTVVRTCVNDIEEEVFTTREQAVAVFERWTPGNWKREDNFAWDYNATHVRLDEFEIEIPDCACKKRKIDPAESPIKPKRTSRIPKAL